MGLRGGGAGLDLVGGGVGGGGGVGRGGVGGDGGMVGLGLIRHLSQRMGRGTGHPLCHSISVRQINWGSSMRNHMFKYESNTSLGA